MRVRVTWLNGTETDFFVATLRELDTFVGQHSCEGIRADFKPLQDGVRLLFLQEPALAA
jgi:hypothetical protein